MPDEVVVVVVVCVCGGGVKGEAECYGRVSSDCAHIMPDLSCIFCYVVIMCCSHGSPSPQP